MPRNGLDALTHPPNISQRHDLRPSDRDAVRRIVTGSGFFTAAEVDVAVELVDDRLEKADASSYQFIIADSVDDVVGYACFGEIACTTGSFDLYWVAVDPARRRQGLGRWLVAAVEQAIAIRQGRKVYVETSSRPLYEPTRAFYLRCGYSQVAQFPDFYAPGDAKVVYEKMLTR